MAQREKLTFEEAANRYYDRLYRAALFMTGDPWVAEDVVQETFIRARKSWESFRGEASYYTWLYRIMVNAFRKRLRKNKKMVSVEQMETSNEDGRRSPILESATPAPPELAEKAEESEIVRAAIDSMPPHHREVLELRFLEEKSYEEIAETLECSIGTVKSRLHYAMKRIGETMRAAESRRELSERVEQQRNEED